MAAADIDVKSFLLRIENARKVEVFQMLCVGEIHAPVPFLSGAWLYRTIESGIGAPCDISRQPSHGFTAIFY
jgi:hypothetical protein